MFAGVLVATAVVWQVADVVRGHHPAPRDDAHEMHVMPAERYEASSGYVAQAYAMAAEIPDVLDGLFCYCYCASTSGHHSLLDCFRDEHAASCGVCLDEAVTAFEMMRQGASLDDVRAEIDRRYRA